MQVRGRSGTTSSGWGHVNDADDAWGGEVVEGNWERGVCWRLHRANQGAMLAPKPLFSTFAAGPRKLGMMWVTRGRGGVTAKNQCSWRTRSKKARSDISRPSLISFSLSRGTGFWNPIALRSNPVPRGVGHEREEALDSPDSVARLRYPAPGRGRLGGLTVGGDGRRGGGDVVFLVEEGGSG